MRSRLRLASSFVAAFMLAGVLTPFWQQNLQEWAKSKGYDQFLVKHLDFAMDSILAVLQAPWFIFAAGFLIGGAAYLWADYFLRRPTPGDQRLLKRKEVQLQEQENERLRLENERQNPTVATAGEVALFLQFSSDDRTVPRGIRLTNVRTWRAMYTESAEARDPTTGARLFYIPPSWTVFILFDKPTTYRQMVATCAGPGNPVAVMAFDDERFAIVRITGSVAHATLEIRKGACRRELCR